MAVHCQLLAAADWCRDNGRSRGLHGVFPGNLQIVDLGVQGWAVMDGLTRIALLDDEPDAELTLKLAQQYILALLHRARQHSAKP